MLEGYTGEMQLELPGGATIRCRAPLFQEAMELWNLRNRIDAGEGEAVTEMLQKAPKYLGLEAEIHGTPMLPRELLQLVDRFFVLPPRRQMRPLNPAGGDGGGLVASPSPT